MRTNPTPAALVAECCKCGDEVILSPLVIAFGERDILCKSCMRKPEPRPWTKQLYAEYLKTFYWQTTRNAALKRAGHRCQVCASRERLEVHHNCYDNLGGEPLVDLVVLCRGCHELFHKEM